MLSARDGWMLAPAVVAAVVAWVLGRLTTRESLARHSVAAALGLAFCAGFFVIHEWANAVPSKHSHWTLYVAIGGAVLGPIVAAQGVAVWERVLLAMLASLASAFVLVPTWETLAPSRIVWVSVLAADLAILAILIQPLPQYLSPRVVLLAMSGSALVLTGLLTAIWSLSLGKIAAIPALALLGVGFVTWFRPVESGMSGAALAYSLMVGGAAFLGCIEPDPPVWPLLAVPPAPIVLWLSAKGPLSQPLPRKLLCGGLLLPILYVSGVVTWIALTYGALDEG
jgi:hypothetical protein